MESVHRDNVPVEELPGRGIRRIVGKGASLESGKMTVAIAHYSAATGPMEPHNHAEETIFVLDAENAWISYGPSPDELPNRLDLEPGLTLHIPELEWHVFEWGDHGFADCLVIYGQVDNIRPEDVVAANGARGATS